MPMRKVLVGVTGRRIVVAVHRGRRVGADSLWPASMPSTGQAQSRTRGQTCAIPGNLPFIPQAMREHYAELEIICRGARRKWHGHLKYCAFDRLVLRVLADQARCQAPGRAGESHHRLSPRYLGISDLWSPRPVRRATTPPAALPSPGYLAAAGCVQRHAHIGHFVIGSASGGPNCCLDDRVTLVIKPPLNRRRDRTRHRGPTGSG